VAKGAARKAEAKQGKASGLSEAELRRRLTDACKILAMEGQGDAVWGHVTVRRPGEDTFLMKPATLGIEEVKAADHIVVDLHGKVVRGKMPRHSEVFIHSEVMRARQDVCAVVHTHPTYATVFASLGVPLRPITHEGSNFAPGDVPRFTETTDLIVTPERGKAVARTLGDRNALFLVSHGIVTCGPTVEQAVVHALVLDIASRAQLMVPGGLPKHWTADEEAIVKHDRIFSWKTQAQRWPYLLRKLKRWERLGGYRFFL
jgi:L-fuculose-phosphate aldolase